MFLDIRNSPVFFQRVRYSITKQENTAEWEKKKVYIYNYVNKGTDGFQLEEGDQQVHSPPADNKSPVRTAKLCKKVLWILMFGVIITLAIYFPLELVKMNKSNSNLQAKLLDMAANNSQLEASYEILRKNHSQLTDKANRLKDQARGKRCPDGWTRFGCNCYCKFKETKSWSDSRRHCQDREADLVIIDSPDEQEFVKKLNENGESWIGLRYVRTGATRMSAWSWVDGSRLTQTFWGAGWPWVDTDAKYATCCNDEGKWTHRYFIYNYSYNPSSWICEK